VWHGEFRHPRLVEVYDAVCVWSREDEFFVSVVGETPAARVLDLGCGTGRLTLALAAAGHRVTGVDPAPASLEAARAKPGADAVTWIEGTSKVLPDTAFDVAVMSAHVAQFLVDDEDWHGTLRDLRRCLVPGGRVVFDTRDPQAAAWERWNPEESRRPALLPDGVTVDTWGGVESVRDGVVSFAHHYVFSDGERLQSTAAMRWRSDDEIRADLTRAGLVIDEIFGGWNREPVGAGDGELLVLAHRPKA
jgi:SAM-dependent methyltransferase